MNLYFSFLVIKRFENLSKVKRRAERDRDRVTPTSLYLIAPSGIDRLEYDLPMLVLAQCCPEST